jgi:hypothetical protein
MNAKKSVFLLKETVHLGHLIDNEGLHPDRAKTKAIVKFPRPGNVTQLRAFLGLASLYRSVERLTNHIGQEIPAMAGVVLYLAGIFIHSPVLYHHAGDISSIHRTVFFRSR